jgi:hypothetical protein
MDAFEGENESFAVYSPIDFRFNMQLCINSKGPQYIEALIMTWPLIMLKERQSAILNKENYSSFTKVHLTYMSRILQLLGPSGK